MLHVADDPTQQHALPPDSGEFDRYSFVIKLYVDEGGGFRGHITHAVSRRRQVLHHPEDVLAFLEPYVASMNVRLRPMSRLILWMSRMAGGAPFGGADVRHLG